MAGQYDNWLSREPDPDEDRVRLDRPEEPTCDDCSVAIDAGAMHVITDDGQARTYCHACGHARSQAGWLFDTRSLAALRRSA